MLKLYHMFVIIVFILNASIFIEPQDIPPNVVNVLGKQFRELKLSKKYEKAVEIGEKLDKYKKKFDKIMGYVSLIVKVSDMITAAINVHTVHNHENLLEDIDYRRRELNSKIDNLQLAMLNVEKVIKDLPEKIRETLRQEELRGYIADLNKQFTIYKDLKLDTMHYNNATLDAFVNMTLYTGSSVKETLDRMRFLIFSKGGEIERMSNSLQKLPNDERCRLTEAPYQTVYNMYNTVTLKELQGYIMMHFAYMLKAWRTKHVNKQKNSNFRTCPFAREIKEFSEKFQKYMKEHPDHFDELTKPLSRDLWKCDPDKNKNETYIELTPLLQGYIENEKNLNWGRSCGYTCATLNEQHVMTHNGHCDGDACQHQRRCGGRIYNCQSFKSNDVYLCWTDRNSNQRYTYLKDGDTLKGNGRSGDCVRAAHIHTWLYWLNDCEYCFCLCDEIRPNTNRYFSLVPVIADITNNRVITGLQFVEQNNMIYIKIQEGKLLSEGGIDEQSVKWVDVKETSRNKSLDGEDFYTLTWSNRRLDLDHILTNKGYALTGIRFVKTKSRLSISIAQTPFNFLTGQLKTPQELYWKCNNASTKRDRVDTDNKDIPIRSQFAQSEPNFKPNQYVEFTHTGMYSDLLQHTVPYLDAQPVTSSFPTPLGGAGIFHKGNSGSGGFIAPIITTYNFNQHLPLSCY